MQRPYLLTWRSAMGPTCYLPGMIHLLLQLFEIQFQFSQNHSG